VRAEELRAPVEPQRPAGELYSGFGGQVAPAAEQAPRVASSALGSLDSSTLFGSLSTHQR
jgi:hypothetical protein